MATISEKIARQIDSIPPVERAELIEALLRSFDRNRQDSIDKKWTEEAEGRIDAYEQGKISTSSLEDVFARINRQ